MKRTIENINSTPLKTSRELVAMLKQLPREERLCVEGLSLVSACGTISQQMPGPVHKKAGPFRRQKGGGNSGKKGNSGHANG